MLNCYHCWGSNFQRSVHPCDAAMLSETRSSWWWWLSWYDSSLWSLPGDTNYWSGKRCCCFFVVWSVKKWLGVLFGKMSSKISFLEWRRGLVLYNLQLTFRSFVSFLKFLILICNWIYFVFQCVWMTAMLVICDLWFALILPINSAFSCATGRGHRTYVQRFKPRGACVDSVESVCWISRVGVSKQHTVILSLSEFRSCSLTQGTIHVSNICIEC